ncbi:aminopeptidase [Borrelia hermsii]|uniref:M18 family aminopeptidase n=3 Tax=Borrelia hermsii TaxID=140 RepID=A0AAN0X5I7_BORHE|nr:aminopeptidase [Borrelia hermsii]AAX16876.1 probable M18-family aminopeptidase 1 [Borrelia hermsii DAH]AJW73174.1 aminopeptidase 1 [Borrelia hermsii CC1]AMR75473.1 putative M18-family aminopeptidase 1 [Borrelia hermsii]ANA43175.1 aminopeptidase [Borrelia hermsii HS1]UCP01382.1 aminopeptidase [Borrelia hermsii]
MTKQNPWVSLNEKERNNVLEFAQKYKKFLSTVKTEREATNYAIQKAKEKGFINACEKQEFKAGDKIFYTCRNKNIALIFIGREPIENGMNFIVSHTDSPRLDAKPSPIAEENEFTMMKTNYYGGIKKYQWLSLPLSIRGVIFLQNGEKVEINIGDDNNDPVFVIPDILPHLDRKVQRDKKADDIIEGENLKIIIGSLPIDTKEKEKVKFATLKLIKEKYKIEEEDFVSAEIEIVPAGEAKDVGFDRALIGAYGQDDRVCVYTSLEAILNLEETPSKTAVCFLVDKEEIGSTGSTGLNSRYLEYFVSDIIFKLKEDKYNNLLVQKVLWNSKSISADVCGAINPLFKSVHDEQNAPKLGYGIPIMKYTGHGGKIMASDSDAELVSYIRNLLNKNNIAWQVATLGKVDEGGGGTVAKFLAHYGIRTIDMGPGVISMHSPFEITSKFDIYTSYMAYKAFFEG